MRRPGTLDWAANQANSPDMIPASEIFPTGISDYKSWAA
jgi:hypothetical protein